MPGRGGSGSRRMIPVWYRVTAWAIAAPTRDRPTTHRRRVRSGLRPSRSSWLNCRGVMMDSLGSYAIRPGLTGLQMIEHAKQELFRAGLEWAPGDGRLA